MKKIYVIIFTVFLNGLFFSCTPENISDQMQTQGTGCCGDDGDIDPPPPPPPPTGDKKAKGDK